ncbi:MAG TPA: plastocyanin/azurin family copper-binding protein, partial [Humisphaera sp.]
ALGKDEGAAARKQLRGLVPALVKVRTYREQMLYDTAYFVVEAGKPVQVSLENDDAMQHNIVIVQPGTLGKVAGLAAGMQPPSDENAKAFVPEVPEVVAASKLANPDETLVVSFAAPAKPGEYPYVCTFPGHAERMNGIMLVVPDIDAWEKAGRTPPTDPKTKKPYASDKVESMEGPAPAGGHQH